MDKRSIINRTYLVTPITGTEKHYLDIVAGRVAYQTTPCPETGGYHLPHGIRIEDFPWATIECGACGWRALAMLEDQYEDEIRNTGGLFDMTMIETAIPDDEYQQQGYPVHLWSEPITAQTSRRGFGSLGLDVIGYKYHTHDRLPVLDSDGDVVWPV